MYTSTVLKIKAKQVHKSFFRIYEYAVNKGCSNIEQKDKSLSQLVKRLGPSDRTDASSPTKHLPRNLTQINLKKTEFLKN